MTRFEPGDLILLKSGGPLMTVRVQTGRIVEADWFIAADPVSKLFHADQLARYEEPEQVVGETGKPVLVRDNEKGPT